MQADFHLLQFVTQGGGLSRARDARLFHTAPPGSLLIIEFIKMALSCFELRYLVFRGQLRL